MEKVKKSKLHSGGHEKSLPKFESNFKPNCKTIAKSDTTSKMSASTSQSSAPIHSNQLNMSVDYMTSRDFQHDTHAHLDFTAAMLKDQIRIQNFQAVISYNKHLFRNKIVLDIGCGTGILSLFAAKAGAARVFAVDPSNVVDYTRQIVRSNRYENIIEVIKGRIEDVDLPVEHVDIILCDWMGYSLLYQSTCDAVIYARDKWLRTDQTGIIFPDVARLYIAGIEDSERKNEKIEWWKDVYGFNMKCLREFALKEPSFHAVHPDQVITTGFAIKTINMYTVKRKDLRFRSKYMLRVLRHGLMDGVVTYFQVRFSKSHTTMGFSTDPWSPHTSWMQSVFFFDQPVAAYFDENLCGGFEMIPADSDNPNLNNMEASLELYSGEPMQLQIEMHWQLKPHTATMMSGAPSVTTPHRNVITKELKNSAALQKLTFENKTKLQTKCKNKENKIVSGTSFATPTVVTSHLNANAKEFKCASSVNNRTFETKLPLHQEPEKKDSKITSKKSQKKNRYMKKKSGINFGL